MKLYFLQGLSTLWSSCPLFAAETWTIQLIPTLEAEMGTVSHSLPRGSDREAVPLRESHYLISERFTQSRSEINGQRSIGSMSHTGRNTTADIFF